MKLRKRIAAFGAAVVMAVSMMSIGAGAYSLSYYTNAPSYLSKTIEHEYIGGIYGSITKIKVYSNSFTTILPGAYVKVSNLNMSSSPYVNVNQANKQYSFNVNLYLTGENLHNCFEIINGAASISVTATGTTSHD